MTPPPPQPTADTDAHDGDQHLPAHTVDALCAAVADEPVAAGRRERLRRRLLRRIADANSPHLNHLTVAHDDVRWQPFADGIRIQVLHAAGGVMSYLLQLESGACLPPHRHPHDEECVVLAGRLRVGDSLVLQAGSFHLARAGSLHAPIVADGDATIFLRGAVPDIADLI